MNWPHWPKIKMKKAYESSRTTLADSMSGEDFAFLNLVEDNVDLDIPPLRAVEMARDAIRVYGTTDPSTADQAYNSSLGKDTNERNEAINSALSDFVDDTNWDGVDLPPEAAVEFNELSRLMYRQHGKLGPAQSTAWSMLKQRWGEADRWFPLYIDPEINDIRMMELTTEAL